MRDSFLNALVTGGSFAFVVLVIAGGIGGCIQILYFLIQGHWHYFTIIDALAHFKVQWADTPDFMIGAHWVMSNIDAWMLLPIGVGWFWFLLNVVPIILRVTIGPGVK